MKTLKLIDFSIQALILAGSILWAIFTISVFPLILIYIGLGIYQPLSFFIQLMTCKSITKPRQRYGLGVLAFFILLGVTANLTIDIEDTLYVFFGCAAAVLAFYYIAISYFETFEDKQ